MERKCLQVLTLCAAVLMLGGCQLMPAEESLPPTPVIYSYEKEEYQMATVMRGDMALTSTARCTYDLTREEVLSFSLGGLLIDSVLVTEGQEVKAGDLLATLEQESIQQQIASQEHQLNIQYTKKRHLQEALQLELDSYNALIAQLQQELTALQQTPPDSTDEPSADRDSAIRKLQQQIHALQQKCAAAQETYNSSVRPLDDAIYVQYLEVKELEETAKERKLIAGIDGIVTDCMFVLEGERSVKDKAFITISDLSSAVFAIDAKQSHNFPVGTRVTFECQNNMYSATVVDPAALGITGKAAEKAYMQLDQPDPTLSNGARGTITLILDERTNVLYVNKKAIHTVNGEPFVYMLDESGLRTMRFVSLGLELKDTIEITAGLEEGDQVIIE